MVSTMANKHTALSAQFCVKFLLLHNVIERFSYI